MLQYTKIIRGKVHALNLHKILLPDSPPRHNLGSNNKVFIKWSDNPVDFA